MICREVIRVIEESFGTEHAMEWDNVGLLTGRMDKEVKKIYLALDATDEVIGRAVWKRADMLVTHHPMIFSPVKKVTDEDMTGRRILKLAREDVAYYAMHTNYDVMRMADLAAKKLGFIDWGPLEVTEYMEDGTRLGIGSIGRMREGLALSECCEIVKEQFGLSHVRVYGDLKKEIHLAAVCPGSGKNEIKEALKKGADVLITGDIGHHEGIDAVSEGLAIIDAGHYGLEYIFQQDMKEFFQKNLPEIEIAVEPACSPFYTV